ncbi:MAG: 16S rRNA (uracil(1498)-N(3))-methyltransferase [Spirochaetaceae bacterium]|nr:16S rRNA (uracil(1498)-N(3))-methyltransferase [Spirochaetaceae bacterium]
MKQFILPFEVDSDDVEVEKTHTLGGRDFHYLIRVRRGVVGDRIPARSRDGGRTYEMELLRIGREACSVSLHPTQPISAVRKMTVSFEPNITLIPAVTKGKKMDLSLRQAVECGALAVWPFLSRYSQVKFHDEKDLLAKTQRWERICVEALQQCGGTKATDLSMPRGLEDILAEWGKRGPLFFLHEKKPDETTPEKSLHGYLAKIPEEMAIMVGPEGGLSDDETERLLEFGAHPIYLGHRVLRAETAVVYGLAAITTIIREKAAWQPV